jgi:molybdopterin synthase catalytic subunit
MLKITREDFSIDEIVQKIKTKETGAIVSFMGFVRGKSKDKIVDKFEIQVSEEMVIRQLEKIRAKTLQKFKVNQIAIVQRIGSLKVSENILLIVVGAPHRDEAFKACGHVLEQIKKVAKMWEKETYREGKLRD